MHNSDTQHLFFSLFFVSVVSFKVFSLVGKAATLINIFAYIDEGTSYQGQALHYHLFYQHDCYLGPYANYQILIRHVSNQDEKITNLKLTQ